MSPSPIHAPLTERLRRTVASFVARRRAGPAPATKASRTGPLIAIDSLRRPVWAPRDYAAFAREGFAQNAIVYRSVRMVAEAVAAVPLLLYDGDGELESHPLLDLLRQPNPAQTTPDLIESFVGFLLVSGNAYLEAVGLDGRLRELHALRPDRMQLIPGRDGWPEAYEYSAGGRSVSFADDAVPGVRPILHLKLFHPANDHYGLSPLEAAATAIDIHNTAARWNKALLDNSARPSGALVYTSKDSNLTPEQYERLKSELELGFQGAAQAGRPLLLEGGLDWKSMSLSPKDMDFLEAKNAAAREIALAIGVPPMLLGIPGDNTYSNYQEATRAFWRQTVLPLVNRTAKALSAWLAPAYGTDLHLRPDLDQVEALAPEREALWSRLEAASFLTQDEKRAAAGYDPLPPLPVLHGEKAGPGHLFRGRGGNIRDRSVVGPGGPPPSRKFNPHHDELGRFTTADGAGGTDAGFGLVSEPTGNQDDEPSDHDSQDADIHLVGRNRRGGPSGSPAQEARLDAAAVQARAATQRARELDPNWKPPQSATATDSIEGRIAHYEAVARAAEARLAEITRDAVQGSNPSWGVNRLTKELYERGFILQRPAEGSGLIYENPVTGEQIRIMERPESNRYRSDPYAKHLYEYYYRYRTGRDQGWGEHIPIPDK